MYRVREAWILNIVQNWIFFPLIFLLSDNPRLPPPAFEKGEWMKERKSPKDVFPPHFKPDAVAKNRQFYRKPPAFSTLTPVFFKPKGT